MRRVGGEDSARRCQHFTAHLDGLLHTCGPADLTLFAVRHIVCLSCLTAKGRTFAFNKETRQTDRAPLRHEAQRGGQAPPIKCLLCVDLSFRFVQNPAHLLLCTGSWAQRICRGFCQRCRRGAAPWLALDYEVLQSEEQMTHFVRPGNVNTAFTTATETHPSLSFICSIYTCDHTSSQSVQCRLAPEEDRNQHALNWTQSTLTVY